MKSSSIQPGFLAPNYCVIGGGHLEQALFCWSKEDLLFSIYKSGWSKDVLHVVIFVFPVWRAGSVLYDMRVIYPAHGLARYFRCGIYEAGHFRMGECENCDSFGIGRPSI